MARTIKMPSQSEMSRHYDEATSRVPAAYKDGVSANTSWHDNAVAGQKLYEQKMSDAEVLRRREKALARTTHEEWKSRAAELGAARIGPGMKAGAGKRAARYEPFRAALDGLTLSDKTPDPMVNIDNNVKAVVKRLVETKKGQ